MTPGARFVLLTFPRSFGNAVTSDNSTVITATRHTGSASLQGTTTATAVNGLATFANLSYNKAETISIDFSSGLLAGVTSGNVIVGAAVAAVHESVKEGETITSPLEGSGVFPPMVISMVDVGEQTGALPEMLLKIADNYDEEVDNAVAAMTSLLEPIMIVFLAVVVGSIVIAMFMPLIELMNRVGDTSGKGGKDD